MKIYFTVFGSPVAQPRVKAQAVMSKTGRMFAHVYEPGKKDSPARQWKSDIKTMALQTRNGTALWTGALGMIVVFYLPRPKNLMRKKDPPGIIYHPGGKDVDNLYKAVADALNGVLYVDDRQVAAATIQKFYHEKDRGPRAEISIWEIDGNNETGPI